MVMTPARPPLNTARFVRRMALPLLAGVLSSPASSASALSELTAAHTRVVWLRDASVRDYKAVGDKLALVGMDSQDGLGERVIVPGPGNKCRPLLSHDGSRVVFTESSKGKDTIRVVGFDGSGLRTVARGGVAADLWTDPANGTEWVYCWVPGKEKKGEIRRLPLDGDSDRDARKGELVWGRTPIALHGFDLSRDGRRAVSQFPHPHAYVVDLPDGEATRFGSGCWTSLAPDDSGLLWVFNRDHRSVSLRLPDGTLRRVDVHDAPGIDDWEVYHPRWTNHPRYFVVTGPYTQGEKGKINTRGGGKDVEVYVGRFSPDYTRVEAWAKVTANQTADFMPDAWVEGGEKASVSDTLPPAPPSNPVADVPKSDCPALKDAFPFHVGAALSSDHFRGKDKRQTALILKHFNSITPSNSLKPASLEPEEGKFTFDTADQYVAFGEKHHMKTIGHTLVWYRSVPDWFFVGPDGQKAGRDLLVSRLETYIKTVVGRYRGRIAGWDVVNEAFESDGSMRKNKWYEIIGPDYLELAFRFAHEADPECELYYNDFDMHAEGKRESVVRMVREFREKGIRIDAVGLQTHAYLASPKIADYEASVRAFIDAGVKVMATEVDVSVLPRGWDLTKEQRLKAVEDPKYNPWPDGLPAEMEETLAARYAEFFTVFRKYADHIDRVTFWGVEDGGSWLNKSPVKGRTDYPLLFDRNLQPKKAFYRVLDLPETH